MKSELYSKLHIKFVFLLGQSFEGAMQINEHSFQRQ